MKNLHKNQQGFEFIAVLALVVVIVGVAAIGYRVLQKKSNTAIPSAPSTSVAKVPASIKTTADVRQASKALDSDLGSSQLDTKQLDGDLVNLL